MEKENLVQCKKTPEGSESDYSNNEIAKAGLEI